MLETIAAFNMSLLAKLANELGITKDNIVQIICKDNKYYMMYQKKK